MSTEAMKQALEALELWLNRKLDEDTAWQAHTALRQAIAEAEKQEPVGWIDSKGNMICTKINESCKPLYTTPQQRTWVGLTDEEMNEAMGYWSDDSRSAYGGAFAADGEYVDMISTWRYIEAKLKEKNT